MSRLLLVAALLLSPLVSGRAGAAKPPSETVISITAKRFAFAPQRIELKVGVPVILELSTLDRKHGFAVPGLHVDAVITPGKPTRVRVVPDKAGVFAFHCSVFCGGGHEDMGGEIVVVP